jgi:hypothetical protein
MRRFGRRRWRGGDGGGGAARPPVDASWLARVVEAGLADVERLDPLRFEDVPDWLCATGVGATASGEKRVVSYAPSAVGALLGAVATGVRLAADPDFRGRALAVAPTWQEADRRLLGLLTRLPLELVALAASSFVEQGAVAPELRAAPVATPPELAGAALASPAQRALFERALAGLRGLAAKHGGAVRGADGAVELVLLARPVATLRAGLDGLVLEAREPARATHRPGEGDLADALDRLEGQLRKLLGDRSAREGEEGFRARVAPRLAEAAGLRLWRAWPIASEDRIDLVGVDAQGTAVVGALRRSLDLPALAAVLEAALRIEPLLPYLLAAAEPPLRIGPAALVLGAADTTAAADCVLAHLGLSVRAFAVRESSGGAELTARVLAPAQPAARVAAPPAPAAARPPTAPREPTPAPRGIGTREPAPAPSEPWPAQRETEPRTPAPRETATSGERIEAGAYETFDVFEEEGDELQGAAEAQAGADEAARAGAPGGRRRRRRRGRRGRGGEHDGERGPERAVVRDGERAADRDVERGFERTAAPATGEEPTPRPFLEMSLFDVDEEGAAAGEEARGRGRRRRRRGGRGRRDAGAEEGEEDERGSDTEGEDEERGAPGAEAGAAGDVVDEEALFELSPDAPDLEEAEEPQYEAADLEEQPLTESERLRLERDRRRRARLAAAPVLEGREGEGAAVAATEEGPRPLPRGRAAILALADRASVAAALLLARETRGLEGLWVYPQSELMTFFRGVATDLRSQTPIFVVGFEAKPVHEAAQAAALYRDRLVWFGCGDWPPEDLHAMRQALGAGMLHVTPGAESPLPAVLAQCGRRSRFSDKLVDLVTGAFTQHDWERWGRLWWHRLGELGRRHGDRRADVDALLQGRPSDLAKEAARIPPPPLPAEVEFAASRDFRVVHFGSYALVVVEAPADLDVALVARIVRERFSAPLSLARREGRETWLLAGEEVAGRALDVGALVDHLAEKLEYAKALPDTDGVARLLVRDLHRRPERLDEVIAEIGMSRSILEG